MDHYSHVHIKVGKRMEAASLAPSEGTRFQLPEALKLTGLAQIKLNRCKWELEVLLDTVCYLDTERA